MIRKIITLLLASLILAGATHSLGADHKPSKNPIRFGLTAVVVRENLRFLDRWAQYLSTKMERPVEFVRRRSYREVMDMLELGKLDFAWICGFPFVQNRNPEFLDIMTVPIYAGAPLYHSYIIVHADSPFETVADLEGKVFAFSDPESNSGFLYPQHVLAEAGHSTEHFFRQTFFTYSHAETVEAVAEHVADGGAVDSYIWEYLQDHNSEFAEKTRIIQKSPPFGFPPLVSRRGVDAEVVGHLTRVLLEMSDDPKGRVFLDGLKLDGFANHPADLFDNIRQMANDTRKALLWIRSAETKASTVP